MRLNGWLARLNAVWCVLRGHDVVWRTKRDVEMDCPGDILCKTCDVLHWCRWYDGR